MEKHKNLIHSFYDAFARGDKNGMVECYHEEITFEDPGFGVLKGDEARNMWSMLLDRSKGGTIITYQNVIATDTKGSADWRAEYTYGPQKRKVVNNISAAFEFKDGLIWKHTDTFNLWKWSSQALGMPGYLLGWSPFLRNKIQKMTNKMLRAYTANGGGLQA